MGLNLKTIEAVEQDDNVILFIYVDTVYNLAKTTSALALPHPNGMAKLAIRNKYLIILTLTRWDNDYRRISTYFFVILAHAGIQLFPPPFPKGDRGGLSTAGILPVITRYCEHNDQIISLAWTGWKPGPTGENAYG